jgi:hypothetical protein
MITHGHNFSQHDWSDHEGLIKAKTEKPDRERTFMKTIDPRLTYINIKGRMVGFTAEELEEYDRQQAQNSPAYKKAQNLFKTPQKAKKPEKKVLTPEERWEAAFKKDPRLKRRLDFTWYIPKDLMTPEERKESNKRKSEAEKKKKRALLEQQNKEQQNGTI